MTGVGQRSYPDREIHAILPFRSLAHRRRQALLPDHRTGRMHEPLQSDGAMLDWIAVPDFLAAYR